MKRILTPLLATGLLFSGILGLNAKKTLSHEDFDGWQRVQNYSLSRDGRWAAYAEVPQEGDATLYFYNTGGKRTIVINRGYKPSFTADGRYGVALIKPFFADTRKAKIDKKKGYDMPQDSLAIIDLRTGDVEKIASVKDYAIGKEGGNWIAYKSTDTLHIKKKNLKDKDTSLPLVVRNLAGPQQKIVKWVDSYVFSKAGTKIALSIKKPEKDTLSTNGTGLILLPDTSFYLLDRDKRHYGVPVFDENGTKLAFTASDDSIKSGTREYRLMLCNLDKELFDAREIYSVCLDRRGPNLMKPHAADPETQKQLEEEWQKAQSSSQGRDLYINQYSVPRFSHNGKRLIIGVAPKVAPDDTTIYDFERADLDIWRWDAPYTPPNEKKNVKRLRERTYPVAIDLQTGTSRLLYFNSLEEIMAPDRWDGDYALLSDPSEEIIHRQWNYLPAETLYSLNISTGKRNKICDANRESYWFSPSGKHVAWFKDRAYFCADMATGECVEISTGVDVPLWDTEDDHPMPSQPYGVLGWTEAEDALLVYDKYDIWQLSADGKSAICLTKGEGRKTGRTYRYEDLDPERRMLKKGDLMVLRVFDHADKRNGLATMRYGSASVPQLRV
ncbi:MAG: hypothetical protein K2F64_04100, partial [Muribaculaceae bacterium]|nr:hypothetical protein [Muribaculaceae bacterium]